MWFPNGVWFTICEYLFPIWGRNPWLKKYDAALASLPNRLYSRQPRRLIKFIGNDSIKFIIELEYLHFYQAQAGRFIKIYTLDNV